MVAPIRRSLNVSIEVLFGASFVEVTSEVLLGEHDLGIKAA